MSSSTSMLDREWAIEIGAKALDDAGVWRTVGDHEPVYIHKNEYEMATIVVDAINKAIDA